MHIISGYEPDVTSWTLVGNSIFILPVLSIGRKALSDSANFGSNPKQASSFKSGRRQVNGSLLRLERSVVYDLASSSLAVPTMVFVL